MQPWQFHKVHHDLCVCVIDCDGVLSDSLSLVAFYPVITVFYRVITGFLTFCSDRGKFGLTAPLLGRNYRYRGLPGLTGGDTACTKNTD